MEGNYDIRPAIVTQGLKTAMMFIDRVGFPILVALLMWYLNLKLTTTIEALNVTLTKQTVVLQAVSDRLGIRVVHDSAPEGGK
jgi:hypothetical protein